MKKQTPLALATIIGLLAIAISLRQPAASASDPFGSSPTPINSPGMNAATVTPSDVAPLAVTTRGVYVGGTGNISVIMSGDATATPVIFNAVQAGTLLPIRVTAIKSTNTTATLITAVW